MGTSSNGGGNLNGYGSYLRKYVDKDIEPHLARSAGGREAMIGVTCQKKNPPTK